MTRHVFRVLRYGAVMTALVAMASSPVLGAGFGIFEHGSKAMGMGGAFTAQADDPSAMFFNPGGLAFFGEREFMVGTTLITQTKADFAGVSGTAPGPGVTGEQESKVFYPSHFYWVQPISSNLNFGLSFNTPFGLATEWKNVDSWAGRFVSYKAELQTYDLTPNLAFKISDNVGIGIGVVARFSKVELHRRIPSGTVPQIVPFVGSLTDIADFGVESDTDSGYGFTIGINHRYNESFSWGLSYRSKIKVDYSGDALFTQIPVGIPQLDGLIGLGFPFGQTIPGETSIDFPDTASVGFAFALGPDSKLEVDINWAGWSSFDQVKLTFPSAPQFNTTLEEDWSDSYNYRIGYSKKTSRSSEWRFGYVYDETPQPKSTMSPLLPDANRSGYSVGYGREGDRANFDLALMYLPFSDRTTTNNVSGFNGQYKTTAWLLGLSVGW